MNSPPPDTPPPNAQAPPIKTLFFDFMGTCLDWHTSITRALSEQVPQLNGHSPATHTTEDDHSTEDDSRLALNWREAFFNEIRARFLQRAPPEDIDDTHRRTLRTLLDEPEWSHRQRLTDERMNALVEAWHEQAAWPDVETALPMLRRSFDVVVLANGTARLQADLANSSGLAFDLLLSSELLGLTKPDPNFYKKAMTLLKREPEECMMVASHAYDLRAAKSVGMATVYLQRWSEDLHEDMAIVREENTWFFDARAAGFQSGGLIDFYNVSQESDVDA